MKTLIAISSCERDAQNGSEQAMRDTWLMRLPEGFDFRFFRGRGESEADDVIHLDCADDYHSLPHKTRESCRWALDHDYDFVFRAFTDTCLHPERLVESGFEQHDYFGHFPGGYCPEPDAKGNYCYASGGPGYSLSRLACEPVIASEPDHWAEDLWIGNVMGRNGIRAAHDERFFFKWSRPHHDTISVHLSRGTGNYKPSWMHDCFLELINS